MPDIPGNSSTTSTIFVGGTLSDSLETNGDRDWIRVELTFGQKVTITLDGITLADSYLRVRDSSGALLAENDDIASGNVLDSRLVFTAPTSGVFFIEVGAYNDQGTGTYQLSVDPYTPPPVASYTAIASHLTDAYWGNAGSRHFAATQGATITFNVSALTAPGQTLAREALWLWSDILGINFSEISGSAQITFDDNEDGAHAGSTRSNGIILSADVNVSTQWLTTYGTSLNGYSFQTYIHEIGHALGLGHAGFYNGGGSYATDAIFANDSWSVSVMSYFDQRENDYFATQGFTKAYLVTPMVADIRGMATLYGLATTTRTGDTTYGFNNNSGRSVYSAAVGAPVTAYTVFDSGGMDTLDYSGFSSNQIIDLAPESFSNVGGGIGNVSIAFNTIIENAIGGSGNDVLRGNSANNVLTGGASADTLTGGTGNDTFRDTASGLSGDTITDFVAGDRIVISDANPAGFSFNLSGSFLTYTGGSLTLSGGVTGTLVASAASGGGVQLSVQLATVADVRNDFNGDGRSDILWRNDGGTTTNWLGAYNGSFTDNSAVFARAVPTAWTIAGTGDFNGDGRDDILWRNSDGTTTNWLGAANGSFTDNSAVFARAVPTAWSIAGTGDFNGDGRDDILWRNADGTVTNWLGAANGGFTENAGVFARVVPTAWSIAGTGDFNGDGRDDILWRNSDGTVTNWLGTANGSFSDNGSVFARGVATSWQIDSIGDYNGDGRDDILWRNSDGTVTNWLGTANGSFTDNSSVFARGVPTAWHVEPENPLL